MTVVLTLLSLSLVLTFVTALLIASAMREDPRERPAPDLRREVGGPAFFGQNQKLRPDTIASTVPVEVLLLQLERHVRLEQAAAESFHLCPTTAALHMPTASPLLH